MSTAFGWLLVHAHLAEAVCARAREHGILTVIDGAHAPGQIRLDLDGLGADFYAGNLHKWLCAPKGAGFLYARPEQHARIEPLIISWGYQSEHPSASRLVDYVEWQGTRDISAFLSVPEAIDYQRRHDWGAERVRCHALAVETAGRIARHFGLPPLSPLTAEWVGQMASAPLPASVDTTALARRLYDDYRIEIPILNWNGHKLARCSFQAYNTPEEAQALLQSLSQIVTA